MACFSITGAIAFVLTVDLWIGEDSNLTKMGTASSLTGVFLGTYIAIWLINRDRNKRLEENHVYKVSLLVNLQGIAYAVHQAIYQYSSKKEILDDKESYEKLTKALESQADTFKYWAHLIEQINTNTFVPAKIRTTVALLLHQGIKPIYNPEFALDGDSFLHVTFLGPISSIIESPYVKDDKDETVKHYLEGVRKSLDHINKIIKIG